VSRIEEIRERVACKRLASLIDDEQDRAYLLARVDELAALLRVPLDEGKTWNTTAILAWESDVRAALEAAQPKREEREMDEERMHEIAKEEADRRIGAYNVPSIDILRRLDKLEAAAKPSTCRFCGTRLGTGAHLCGGSGTQAPLMPCPGASSPAPASEATVTAEAAFQGALATAYPCGWALNSTRFQEGSRKIEEAIRAAEKEARRRALEEMQLALPAQSVARNDFERGRLDGIFEARQVLRALGAAQPKQEEKA